MRNQKNSGWIKLHRKITKSDLWFLEPFTKGQAWIDLFLNANHKKGIINIRGNILHIKRGELAWSELTMKKRWKWSVGKVKRFLKLLETIQQIKQQKDRYITTIITILNYEKYQNDTADDTADSIADSIADEQQTIQQTIHKQECNKNVKNVKNDKEEFFQNFKKNKIKLEKERVKSYNQNKSIIKMRKKYGKRKTNKKTNCDS